MKKIKNYYIPDNDRHFENFLNLVDHYQRPQRNRALSFVKKRNVAIDIGANIGLWAKDISSFFDKTYCFEPNPDCIECLEKNINLKSSVIYNVALGEKEETKLLYCPNNTGASSFINFTKIGYNNDGSKKYGLFSKTIKTKWIEVKTFDSFKITNIDFIKIDVQGFEYEVLKGAKKTLIDSSPTICIEETDLENSKSLKFLKKLDYKCVDQIDKEVILQKNI